MSCRPLPVCFAVLPLFLLGACGIDEQVHKKALDDLAACQAQLDSCNTEKSSATEQAQSLNNQREEALRLHDQTKVELAGLTRNLQSTEEEIKVLRKQREAAEKRAAAYRDLTKRMRALVDTGKLKVGFRKGQMVLELPSEILFASGKSKLSRKGIAAMEEVATVLLEFKDRRFMIAGHTDNRKIKGKRSSNWTLSAARAVSIVEFFVKQGFLPENLGATGFGEFDPIADNSTKEGRMQNRRIEIILVPDLSELPTLDTTEQNQDAPKAAPTKAEAAAKPRTVAKAPPPAENKAPAKEAAAAPPPPPPPAVTE